MGIRGVGQNDHQSNAATAKSTKSVINISDHPAHLQDGLKLSRESMRPQESQNAEQKVFHGDSFEVSRLSKNREILMDKMRRTMVRPATALGDMRAGILKEVREEKGQYSYSDVVNACGLSYARLYAGIEQRYENEQYYKADGTMLTKEEEMEWLDLQFDQEVAWQKSCVRIAAQGQLMQGKISEMPAKEMEELEDSFYRAKAAYMKLYRESGRGRQLVMQNDMFGNGRMYEVLDRAGDLRERMGLNPY